MLRQYTNKNDLLALTESFFRLSNNSDFKTIVDWLKFEENRLSKENRQAQDNQLKWNQGGLQAIDDLLRYSDRNEAQKVIEKIK
ncbi:MAG: hypothetical protein KKE05_05035 [Nanoarchaeota archaeon]|nr:hypothetical protein [Nanoarchaeota archaeon]